MVFRVNRLMAKSKYKQYVANYALSKLTNEGEKYAGFVPENEDITHTEFREREGTRVSEGIYFYAESELVKHNGNPVFITTKDYGLSDFELSCFRLSQLIDNPAKAISWQYCYIVVTSIKGIIGNILINGIDSSDFRNYPDFDLSVLGIFGKIKELSALLAFQGGHGWELISHQVTEGKPETHHLTFKRPAELPGDPPSSSSSGPWAF